MPMNDEKVQSPMDKDVHKPTTKIVVMVQAGETTTSEKVVNRKTMYRNCGALILLIRLCKVEHPKHKSHTKYHGRLDSM